MMIAVSVLALSLGALALVCAHLSRRFAAAGAIVEHKPAQPDSGSVDAINALLPQTQCGQCGFPGCQPYAEAISRGEAINRCPPGGQATINRLARLLNTPAPTLDPRHGVEAPRKVAYIREEECIGCTKCIQACPVDAIVGAAKLMHTVITRDCTGCDLCVDPCPVDCIDMLELDRTSAPSERAE